MCILNAMFLSTQISYAWQQSAYFITYLNTLDLTSDHEFQVHVIGQEI